MLKIISRSQAIKRKLLRYFTGKPCKHGHISERHTKSKVCIACLKIAQKKCKGHQANVLKDREKRLEKYGRYISGRPCQVCGCIYRYTSSLTCIKKHKHRGTP